MNFSLEVDKGTIKRVRKLMKDDRFVELYNNKIWQMGNDLKADILENIAERAKDTGRLLHWHMRKRKLSAVVGTNVEYAGFVNDGTRPHRMPIDPLIEWVRRKRKDFGIAPKKVESLAWAVWWKIARKGTEGKKFVDDALEKFDLNSYLDALLKEWENV